MNFSAMTFKDIQVHWSQQLEDDFKKLFPSSENETGRAMAYPLQKLGKCVRPVLLKMMAGCVGGDKAILSSQRAAWAVELAHTYSLVHDDLGCMDNGQERRGQPCVHKVFGEAQGVLVGDGLLAQSFAVLCADSRCELKTLQDYQVESLWVQILGQALGHQGIVEGQWMDMAGALHNLDDVLVLHRQKTGALMGACVEMGLVAGLYLGLQMGFWEPSQEDLWRAMAKKIGSAWGIAFQIADDLQDDVAEEGCKNILNFITRDEAYTLLQSYRVQALEGLQVLLQQVDKQLEATQQKPAVAYHMMWRKYFRDYLAP